VAPPGLDGCAGWLIQTFAGRAGASGAARGTVRAGFEGFVEDLLAVALDVPAVPSWTVAGACSPMPEWRWCGCSR